MSMPADGAPALAHVETNQTWNTNRLRRTWHYRVEITQKDVEVSCGEGRWLRSLRYVATASCR